MIKLSTKRTFHHLLSSFSPFVVSLKVDAGSKKLKTELPSMKKNKPSSNLVAQAFGSDVSIQF